MIEFRTFAGPLEIRAGGDGRTVYGRAAPYNEPTRVHSRSRGPITETLQPGSFTLAGAAVPLVAGHSAELPISPPGTMTEQRDGLYGTWHVSATSAGNDVLALIADRAATGLSVGFLPNEMRDIWNGDAVTRVAAELFHVAVTHEPAFTGGEVLALRANKEPYGSVEYADPGYQSDGVKRYPLDTEKHVRAALSYFGQPANREPYTAAQVAAILSRIHAAAKKLGIKLATDGRAARQLLERRAALYARQDADFPTDNPWEALRHLAAR